MRILPRTAAFRIGLLSAAVFAVTTALIGIAVFFAVHTAFVAQLDDAISQAQTSLIAEYRDDGMEGLRKAIAVREARASSVLAYAVFDADGQRIMGRLDTARPSTGQSRIMFRDPVEGADPAIAHATTFRDGTMLVVAGDLEPVEDMDATILAVFGGAFLAVLALGATFAVGLGQYLRRRLDAIAQGARGFASGALSQRAQVGPRGDEFDQLAASLNAMLERIEALLGNLRQVTSDLAHDMRTPLTRLRNDLEDLQGTPEALREERVDQAIARCDDILSLFAAILRISELEGGDADAHFTRIDLNRLVADLAEAHEPQLEEEGKRIALSLLDAPAYVHGDRDLLAQAMVNLIENALRHSPSGGTISLGVIDRPGYLALQVRDEGEGIALADRECVTKRFVRLEAARNTPGFGLGLALVKAIAEAHGGILQLGDAAPGVDARIVFSEGPA